MHPRALVANCSYSSLTHVPDSLPEQTDWLLLSGNNISSLTTDTTVDNDTLYHLSQLDLHGNNMSKISTGIIDDFIQSNNLLYFNISNNKLTSLPENIKNLTSLRILNISQNEFECSCENFWMKKWLLNETKVVTDFENIKCQMTNGKWIQIIHTDKTDLGCMQSNGDVFPLWKVLGTHESILYFVFLNPI